MEDKTTYPKQCATLSFDMEDVYAEKKLKKMLSVDDYVFALGDFKEKILRRYFKYDEGNKIRFKPRGGNEYKEIVLDYDTMEYVEDAFYSLLEERDIDLEKLIY